MKKNMKGFTLIELLAVIVILAVIALIATPIIMNVINDAKDGANKDAAYGIVKSIETAMAQQSVKNPAYTSTCVEGTATAATISGNSITACGVTATYKGTAPSAMSIKVNASGTISTGTTVTFGSSVYEMKANGEFAAK